jgi:hypothetical protein
MEMSNNSHREPPYGRCFGTGGFKLGCFEADSSAPLIALYCKKSNLFQAIFFMPFALVRYLKPDSPVESSLKNSPTT